MSKRRAVITGVGMVTPVGNDSESTFGALLRGESGVDRLTRFPCEDFRTTIAGEVKNLDASSVIDPKQLRRLDRFVIYGLVAGAEAWASSGLDINKIDPHRAGCIAASGIGGLESIEDEKIVILEKGPRRVTPFLIPKLMINAFAGELSILLGLQGPNWVTASACASGTHAVGSALRAIQYGEADIVVTGGSEAAITPLGVAGFCSMKAMSTRNDDPKRASRPFDKDRDGFVISEGAACLVVEELEHARRRGANILCELVGFGASADAFHITGQLENGEGIQRSMRLALADAGQDVSAIDYVNAHGTSTPLNDPNESIAIRRVFGADADRLAVSSTKSMIGHSLGASGAIESVVCALSIARGVVHQTLNLETPGEHCDLDFVPEGPRQMAVRAAISNSLGFGGHNATAVFKAFR